MREARVGLATLREAANGVTYSGERDMDPIYDDREGHCWRCSHLTLHEDRTCDFCLAEITR